MSKQVFNNNKWGIALKSVLISLILSLVFTSVSFAVGGGRYEVDPWSFGVMADTQWTLNPTFEMNEDGSYKTDEEGNYILISDGDPEGINPEYVSAGLARAIEDEFIEADVKFVIQLGDLTNWAGNGGMAARAAAAQPLIDNEIGFFPIRGNHETYGSMVWRDPDHDMNVPAFKESFPQTQGTSNTFGATNFSFPSDIISGADILDGLSYSFDYGDQGNNARFVFVDVEKPEWKMTPAPSYEGLTGFYFETSFGTTYVVYQATAAVPDKTKYPKILEGTWFRISSTSGNPTTSFYGPAPTADTVEELAYSSDGTEFWPGGQQDWISTQLDKSTRGTEHAFVLSHRGLMGANHPDGFFGKTPADTPEDQNEFYASLVDNGVRYMLSGHDHLHNRALVASPDGENQVQQIIHMAASTKFYGPAALSTKNFAGTKSRETQIAQDLYNVGYYIYTIDGPRVNVDYYADATGNFQDEADYPHGDDSIRGRLFMPDLNFIKKESFGYSTNGQQFVIAQGESYAGVKDNFGMTSAKILSGTNNSTTTDATPTGYAYDEDDKPIYVQQVDSEGNLVFNEDGSPVYVQKVDAEGNPVFDEDNKPVYEQKIASLPNRPLNKVINTGWVANPDFHVPNFHKKHWRNSIWRTIQANLHNKLKSHIFSIWGMSEIKGNGKTDNYVLSMSFDVLSTFFDFKALRDIQMGKFGIATYVNGKWVNAVNENYGGTKKFVFGKYNKKYGLGTYGIDPYTKTAWAVLNYNADFAVAKNIK